MVSGGVMLATGVGTLPVESRSLPHRHQVASMRPGDYMKVAPPPETSQRTPVG